MTPIFVDSSQPARIGSPIFGRNAAILRDSANELNRSETATRIRLAMPLLFPEERLDAWFDGSAICVIAVRTMATRWT